MSSWWYITLFLFCLNNRVYTQDQIKLTVSSSDQNPLPLKFNQTKEILSEFEIHLALKEYLKSLHEDGYLSASVDSISGDSLFKHAYIYSGTKYQWVKLHTDSIDEEIISRTGFRDKQFSNKPLSIKQISTFFDNTLTYLENTGYPFAQMHLEHIQVDSNKVEATVTLQKNQFYKIDSITILGENTRLNRHYIENIIRIKSNYLYDERVIKDIGKRIQEDPFMDELRPYEVIFTETSCNIVLILKPKKANLFDGIIGVQPQDNNKGVIFTGDIKISLGNIVGQGERLKMRWQQLRDQTQQIDASISVPFLFRTPIGFGYDLNIYRRDTTFNNVHHLFNVPFRMSNGTEFYGFYDNFKTTLISTIEYENSTEIPPFNDAENKLYGIGFKASFVQNKFNPYQGGIFEINGGAGTNQILRNSALEMVNYDSVNLESSLLQGHLKLSYFQPITKQTTLLFRANSSFKQTKNLVENQSYRIGGLLSLRGFDEQSIFASSYAIGTIEYRLLFDKNSRISVFYDWAWYELSSITGFITDTPQSFGAGITFGTNAGMFSLNYAIGSQFGNPFNFRTGKIHFGFVNLF